MSKIFVCEFLCQTVPIASDQNLLIRFVSNMYNGNIGTFWHRKLCMKTWYQSTKKIDFRMLEKAVVQIESVIGSKPLTYINEEDCMKFLTSNYMIYGKNNNSCNMKNLVKICAKAN